ncbi:toxin-antitoxin system YwqK family antitoxin [Sanyastnella coralliicola]|uniref:toxin-antitoxin system YwqK family antitoxin n=1 Tax=Sanyastnella coralliicola TaxID=3069118 RepID=UPI0027BAAB08|nr:hypothetical protein [Longitalea sp. SCSIO 12813]
MQRHVVRTHDNGQPYVVVYTVGEFHDRVKEELFYDNGNLDYVGHYKRGVEHGEWIYYWENGNMKSWEYYEKGREEGTHYDCNEKGEKIKLYHYRKGVLIKEEVVSP